MKTSILLILFLGHMLADFPFQSKKISDKKDKIVISDKSKAILIHVIIHISTTLLVLSIFFFINKPILNSSYILKIMLSILIINCLHWFVDISKSTLSTIVKKYHPNSYKIITFSLDQFVHFLIIFFSWLIIFKVKINGLQSVFISLANLSFDNKVIFTCIIAIFCIDFSNYFINNLLSFPKNAIKNDGACLHNTKDKDKDKDKKLTLLIPNINNINSINIDTNMTISSNEKKEYPSQVHFGSTIGKIERILISLFFIAGINTGVVIIISIKTLTRFKAIELDKNFSEYYLLGTLLSVLFGFISAVILRFIW